MHRDILYTLFFPDEDKNGKGATADSVQQRRQYRRQNRESSSGGDLSTPKPACATHHLVLIICLLNVRHRIILFRRRGAQSADIWAKYQKRRGQKETQSYAVPKATTSGCLPQVRKSTSVDSQYSAPVPVSPVNLSFMFLFPGKGVPLHLHEGAALLRLHAAAAHHLPDEGVHMRVQQRGMNTKMC